MSTKRYGVPRKEPPKQTRVSQIFGGVLPDNLSYTMAVDVASFEVTGQSIPLNIGLIVTETDIQPAGQDITLTWTQNWFLTVDSASFQIDGQDVTLDWQNDWSLAVDAAAFQPTGQAIPLNVGIVVAQADISPSGQDVTLTWTQNWTLAVDAAAIQPSGQDVTLAWTQNWSIVVDSASFQIDGQDVSLIASGDTPVTVDSAAFSLSGSDVDLLWTTTAQQQTYSGGWVEPAYERLRKKQNDEIRRELLEEQEREELAERLEKLLIQEGSLTQAQADLIRLRGVAAKYSRDDLPNRARRALAFAERAQSEFSTRLALREIRRIEEEEEMAVLLLMTLD